MFKNKIKYVMLSLLSVSIPMLSSCGLSESEILGRAVQAAINTTTALLTTVTPQQEIEIGKEMTAQISTEYKEYTSSAELVTYVRSIGAKVVTQALRKSELNYQFYILDSTEVNAFTIPGGAVFITTESLKYIKNEAELAGVLAHEVGHNENHHPTESVKRAMAAQGITQGALKQDDSALLKLVSDITLGLILKGFSRVQEKESDETGTSIISKLGYSPNAVSGFMKTLSDLDGGKDSSGLVQLLQTHPGSLERIDNITAYINKNSIVVASPVVNEAIYLKNISVLPPKVALKTK